MKSKAKSEKNMSFDKKDKAIKQLEEILGSQVESIEDKDVEVKNIYVEKLGIPFKAVFLTPLVKAKEKTPIPDDKDPTKIKLVNNFVALLQVFDYEQNLNWEVKSWSTLSKKVSNYIRDLQPPVKDNAYKITITKADEKEKSIKMIPIDKPILE